jgi:hypothetical protein
VRDARRVGRATRQRELRAFGGGAFYGSPAPARSRPIGQIAGALSADCLYRTGSNPYPTQRPPPDRSVAGTAAPSLRTPDAAMAASGDG